MEPVHPMTLKVMRLGRPQPASTLAGGFALDSGVVGSGLLSDGLSQLQLPQGFGVIYAGQWFRSHITVLNHSMTPLRDVQLSAELHIGEGSALRRLPLGDQRSREVAAALASPTSTAPVATAFATGAFTRDDGSRYVPMLAPGKVIDLVVNSRVEAKGSYALRVSVLYTTADPRTGAPTTFPFQKLYRFMVTSPLLAELRVEPAPAALVGKYTHRRLPLDFDHATSTTSPSTSTSAGASAASSASADDAVALSSATAAQACSVLSTAPSFVVVLRVQNATHTVVALRPPRFDVLHPDFVPESASLSFTGPGGETTARAAPSSSTASSLALPSSPSFLSSSSSSSSSSSTILLDPTEEAELRLLLRPRAWDEPSGDTPPGPPRFMTMGGSGVSDSNPFFSSSSSSAAIPASSPSAMVISTSASPSPGIPSLAAAAAGLALPPAALVRVAIDWSAPLGERATWWSSVALLPSGASIHAAAPTSLSLAPSSSSPPSTALTASSSVSSSSSSVSFTTSSSPFGAPPTLIASAAPALGTSPRHLARLTATSVLSGPPRPLTPFVPASDTSSWCRVTLVAPREGHTLKPASFLVRVERRVERRALAAGIVGPLRLRLLCDPSLPTTSRTGEDSEDTWDGNDTGLSPSPWMVLGSDTADLHFDAPRAAPATASAGAGAASSGGGLAGAMSPGRASLDSAASSSVSMSVSASSGSGSSASTPLVTRADAQFTLIPSERGLLPLPRFVVFDQDSAPGHAGFPSVVLATVGGVEVSAADATAWVSVTDAEETE